MKDLNEAAYYQVEVWISELKILWYRLVISLT